MERNRNIAVRLDEQSRDFAHDGSKPVTGTLNISGGGEESAASVKIENLVSGKWSYKLFFMGRKNGVSVYKEMGEIIPDAGGEASFYTKFNGLNIDGEGTDLSCFYIFMIAAAGRPMKPVLKGDLPTGHSGRTEENKNRDYCGFYREYVQEAVAEIISEQVMYPETDPFDEKWLADNWRRSTDMLQLPVASTGARAQIQKYGHYIFAYDEKYFWLAVPGRHTDSEWPDRGRSGFLMWQSIKNSSEFGYWCMVIERGSGRIISGIS